MSVDVGAGMGVGTGPRLSQLMIAIYLNKTCYGLSVDARILEKMVRQSCSGTGTSIQVRTLDMNEPPIQADIAFHLETPVAQVMGYSLCNILMINSEQWISSVYDPYLDSFDLVFVRSNDDLARFQKDLQAAGKRWEHLRYVPWSLGGETATAATATSAVVGNTIDDKIGFVCFIGKNEYKYEWLRDFLAAGGWRGDFPALRIYTSQKEYAEGLMAAATAEPQNIHIECRELDATTIDRLQWLYSGHLLCSRGEGFGYAAAEAEAHGAKLLLSELPVFKEYYGAANAQVAWLPSRPIRDTDTAAPKARRGLRYELMGPTGYADATAAALAALLGTTQTAEQRREAGRQAAESRWVQSLAGFRSALWSDALRLVQAGRPKSGNWHRPPILFPADCPPITIVTPTRNRRKLIDIAFHNLLSTDYPLKRIEWIVVEDSDNDKAASDRFMNFQVNCPQIRIKYIPLQSSPEKEWTIGEKRNIGVEHATSDIILFMDDDDHYPPTSFRRRVAWLQLAAGRGQTICGCSTLALYDLQRGISAVNVPPWDIQQCERLSEATLTFHKDAWLNRKFPEVNVSEGEDWIRGREREFLEIPPQQIIVAFSHGGNSTSRRLPASVEPNGCFWGFPREYLEFVHGLVGVGIEAASPEGQPQKQAKRRVA